MSPSSRIIESLDICVDLTLQDRQRVEEVILKNQLAFGLDGRLGTHDARVEIQLQLDAKPISLLPFPVSPANREVMNQQIDYWIQLGVIEPSDSP